MSSMLLCMALGFIACCWVSHVGILGSAPGCTWTSSMSIWGPDYDTILSNPSAYGLTNTTTPCRISATQSCATPDQYSTSSVDIPRRQRIGKFSPPSSMNNVELGLKLTAPVVT